MLILNIYYLWQSLNPPVLIFVQNKERAKELYNEVKFDDIRADVIHSDLSQKQASLQPIPCVIPIVIHIIFTRVREGLELWIRMYNIFLFT